MELINHSAPKVIFNKKVEVSLTIKELICIWLALGETTIDKISELRENSLPCFSNIDIGNTSEEDISFKMWKELKYDILPSFEIYVKGLNDD